MQYQARDRSSKEQGFFRISQFIWDPADPLFFLFKDQPFVSVFSHREFFADEEMLKGLLTSQTNPPTSIYKRWFIKNTKDIHGAVRPIQIFTTEKYWILFRIGPKRRRKAGMPPGVYY
ncbi:hypothetical protein V6N13_125254 [Hibiscus sabdariffa]